MAKSTQTRLGDSIGYIRTHIGDHLAAHVTTLVAGREAAISEELSLGSRWDVFASAASRTTSSQQRHALRALLLCQRVYYSDLWPGLSGVMAARVAYNWLPLNWKQQSCEFWANRSELEIRNGLRLFVATTDNATHAANAAVSGHPSAPDIPYLNATRDTFAGIAPTHTCYDAVMLWLLKSGLVSLRWFLKHRHANTEATLTEAFGPGRQIWNGAFNANDALPVVPRGHIVHIFQNPQRWCGHWMVSTGNGKAAGCNNNDENPPVPRNYCAALTLKKQFLDYGGGTALVINPTQIPGRL